MPLPPEVPSANMRWALDVLSLRKFFSSDPLDTLNQTRVFAVDGEVTLTDEELVALYHLGRLTPEGVREFAAEREALLGAYRNHNRDRHPAPRIMPLRPATHDRPQAAAAAAGAGSRAAPAAPLPSRRSAPGPKARELNGPALKRGS